VVYTVNTAGTAWLLLAFPGGTEADARRMFSVKDSDTGADEVLRIALAGPAYTGVAGSHRACLAVPLFPM
jgi:hypothetical protein